MALTVDMPQLGESVTEGTIAKWLKHTGDPVAKYESIAEVITDKVNAEIPAPADGVMGELIAHEGEVIAVGKPICVIETEVSASAPFTAQPAPAQASAPAPVAAPAPVPAPEPVAPAPAPETRREEPVPAGVGSAAVATNGGAGAALHMTPAVRMLVREHDVDVSQVQGSGIAGRITKKDVLEFVQRRDAGQTLPTPAASGPVVDSRRPAPVDAPAAAPATPAPSTTPQPAAAPAPITPGEGETLVPLTAARRAIADHMVRSVHTSPHAYVLVEVDMSAVSRFRDREKRDFQQRYGVNLTYLPFVARAVCEALRRHPTLNASWSDEGVVLKRDIHLGIAVALEDNLVVPVVRNADRLSLSGLATTMADLGDRARSNHLKLDEIQGGTFTLNNTGALGAVLTEAIINQPQAAIMTMDMVVKRPVVVEGDHIVIRPIMNLGMSFDHRINDGLAATRFSRTVKGLLEAFDEHSPL